MAILNELKNKITPNLGPINKRSTKFIDGVFKDIKKHPKSVLYTLWAFDFINFVLLVAIPFTYIAQFINYHRPKTHVWNSIFSKITKATFAVSGVKVEAENIEHLPTDRGCVISPNHTSFIDGPLIGSVTSFHPGCGIMAPSKFFAFPFGFWLRKIGNIDVVRDHEERDKYQGVPRPREAIRLAAQKIINGEYILIFPEGHMEREKQLLYFHTGAVRIALKARCDIVPVTIIGASEVLPARKFLLKPGKIKVIFHKPINLSKYYGMYEDHTLVKRLTWELEKDIIENLPKSFIPEPIMERLPEYIKEKKGWE